jgi:hypothetical protein
LLQTTAGDNALFKYSGRHQFLFAAFFSAALFRAPVFFPDFGHPFCI